MATTPATPTLPTIHMNGTSARMLYEGYEEAHHALTKAEEALGKIEFNARDYYPVDGSWEKAREEMRARFVALDAMKDELMAILSHVSDHIK